MTPRIHDISTDTDDPPALVAAARFRKKYHNPVRYEGSRIAHLQRQSYPDISPILSTLPAESAYARARQLVQHFGWQIIGENADAGLIEAVATTRIFRFHDDVVIRITGSIDGSRIDIRSASRLGMNDFGANARRIRDFIHAFNQEL